MKDLQKEKTVSKKMLIIVENASSFEFLVRDLLPCGDRLKTIQQEKLVCKVLFNKKTNVITYNSSYISEVEDPSVGNVIRLVYEYLSDLFSVSSMVFMPNNPMVDDPLFIAFFQNSDKYTELLDNYMLVYNN